MGALTEIEIFDCMTSNLKLAIEACDALARIPLKGATYDKLRKTLRLIEGTCKQAAAWREDTRWLPLGMQMGRVHQMAGDWLRGIKMPDGTRVKITDGELHPCFVKLAENLRGLLKIAENYRTKATGRRGMILPAVGQGPHRDTRPVGWSPPPPGWYEMPNGLLRSAWSANPPQHRSVRDWQDYAASVASGS